MADQTEYEYEFVGMRNSPTNEIHPDTQKYINQRGKDGFRLKFITQVGNNGIPTAIMERIVMK